MDDTLIITLRAPIAIGGETVNEISLREPTVDELDQFAKTAEKHGGIAATKVLIATVSGVNPLTVGKMGARDFKAAEKFLTGFFADSPETGETS